MASITFYPRSWLSSDFDEWWEGLPVGTRDRLQQKADSRVLQLLRQLPIDHRNQIALAASDDNNHFTSEECHHDPSLEEDMQHFATCGGGQWYREVFLLLIV